MTQNAAVAGQGGKSRWIGWQAPRSVSCATEKWIKIDIIKVKEGGKEGDLNINKCLATQLCITRVPSITDLARTGMKHESEKKRRTNEGRSERMRERLG